MKTTMKFTAFFAIVSVICSCGSYTKVSTAGNRQPEPQDHVATAKTSGKVATGPDGKVREWQSQGYMIDGTRTMYDKLVIHYNKIDSNPDQFIECQGTAIGSEKSDARIYALNNAAIQYATAAKSVVEGFIARQSSSNVAEDARVKLMAAYTQKVQSAIVPYLRESVAVYRKVTNNGKDGIEYDIYYIVDENSASKVRNDAMNQSLKETATEQTFGTVVNEYVKTTVRPTEE